jgi:hypothetical protein
VDYDDLPTDAPSKLRRQRRSWWEWNLITLAVSLFALLWVSTLANFSPQLIWTIVAFISLVWWMAPGAILRRWPWPLSVLMETRTRLGRAGHTYSATRSARACRWLAIAFALCALFFNPFVIEFIFRRSMYYASGRPGPFGYALVWLGMLPQLLQYVALAVALWTLAGIADSLHRMAKDEQRPQNRE